MAASIIALCERNMDSPGIPDSIADIMNQSSKLEKCLVSTNREARVAIWTALPHFEG